MNWIGSARSNYFAVKDETAFREWAEPLDLLGMKDLRDGQVAILMEVGTKGSRYLSGHAAGIFSNGRRV